MTLIGKIIIVAVIVLIVFSLGAVAGWRVCMNRRVQPLETIIDKAEARAKLLAEQVAIQVEQIEEAKRHELEAMDAHDIVIEFLSDDDIRGIVRDAESIAGQAAKAVVEYIRGLGIDLVTVHN